MQEPKCHENQFMKHDKLTMNRCNIAWEGRGFVLMIYSSNENTTVTTMLVISYSQLESEAGVSMTHNERFHLSEVMAHRRLWFHENHPYTLIYTEIVSILWSITIHFLAHNLSGNLVVIHKSKNDVNFIASTIAVLPFPPWSFSLPPALYVSAPSLI